MARTDAIAVALTIDTSLTTAQVEAFIDDASVWVDENLVGEGLSATLLKQIEKYLACHLISLRDPRLKSTRRDDVADVFVRDDKVDPYLQHAIRLDPTGIIEEQFTDKPAFSFRVGAGYDDTLTKLPTNSS